MVTVGHEPARSQGFPSLPDNFPNELARVCDSLGKSPAWRGLDAAFPSHFVKVFHGSTEESLRQRRISFHRALELAAQMVADLNAVGG